MTLDSQIILASKGMRRQPDPIESSVGISAHWSRSTVDDGTWPKPFPSSHIAVTVPAEKIPGQSHSKYPPTPESLEVSQLYSILFRIKQTKAGAEYFSVIFLYRLNPRTLTILNFRTKRLPRARNTLAGQEHTPTTRRKGPVLYSRFL